METVTIILDELRALRSDYNEHARDTVERLSVLEVKMQDLCGNGHPGRIALLEAAVENIQQWRWWILGATGAISSVAVGASWLFIHFRFR